MNAPYLIAVLVAVGAVLFGLICFGVGLARERRRIRRVCRHPDETVNCFHGDARNQYGVAWCRVCRSELDELPRTCKVTGRPHELAERLIIPPHG